MDDQPQDSNQVADNEPLIPIVKTGKRTPGISPIRYLIWLMYIPIILAAVAGIFFGYLSLSGIDTTWAIGTSGWVAPPGSKITAEAEVQPFVFWIVGVPHQL